MSSPRRDVDRSQGWVARIRGCEAFGSGSRKAQARVDKRGSRRPTPQSQGEIAGPQGAARQALNESVEGARASRDARGRQGESPRRKCPTSSARTCRPSIRPTIPASTTARRCASTARAKLRSLGMDEGKRSRGHARRCRTRRARGARAHSSAKPRRPSSSSSFADFHERQADLQEFTKGSQERIDRAAARSPTGSSASCCRRSRTRASRCARESGDHAPPRDRARPRLTWP
jgi:hypothetical protein